MENGTALVVVSAFTIVGCVAGMVATRKLARKWNTYIPYELGIIVGGGAVLAGVWLVT